MTSNKKVRNPVFESEYVRLDHCRQIAASSEDNEDLAKHFRDLVADYEKLLRQSEKITRVGDSIQRKLVRAREQIEEKNRELVRAQKMLVRKEKTVAMNTLVAGIAHELSNPLNFINNLSAMQAEMVNDILQAHGETPPDSEGWEELRDDLEQMAHGASIISEHGERAGVIINRMNKLSREDPGVPHLTDVNLLLRGYCRQVRESLRERCPVENLQIIEDMDEHLGEVQLVPGDLGFVITQLLTNALEAMTERAEDEAFAATLVLATRRTDESVVISIRDNGSGVDEEQRGLLFTPFHTTKPTGKGNLGLGLFTCHDVVVNGYGGQMDYQIRDGLTEFSVSLPLETHKEEI